MKQLAIVLAVILAALLVVCFLQPWQDAPTPTEPTQLRSDPSNPSASEPTQSNPTTVPIVLPTDSAKDPTELPTQPSETEATQPSETEPVPTEPVPEPANDDFVLITDWIANVWVKLAYATTENFTGTKIYDFTDAYLRYGTVKKLAAAADILNELGYGIVIWDGYRPVYAQQKLWDVCPDPTYVSPPGTGTQAHCRGIAVDVTLYDLETGEILEMPSGFDEFSALGDRDYRDCTAIARQNALILESAMKECGFVPYSGEWWHFSDTDRYEIEYEFDPASDR